MKRNLQSGQGIAYSIFGGNTVRDSDIEAIQDFEKALKNGLSTGQAWQQTMTKCSVAAKQQAKQCLKTKGSLTDLANSLNATTVSAKATELGLKALSIAGNMLLMYGISKLLTAFSDYRDKLREISSEMSEQAEESANHVQSLLDLKKQLEEGTTSTEDLTTAFREQLRIMGYTETEIDNLIKKYGGLATAINKATDEALKNAKTEAFSDKTASAQLLENAPMFHLFKDIQIDKLSTGYEELDKQIEEIFSDVATIITEDGNGSTVWDVKDYSADGLLAYYNALKKVNELLQETASETGDSNLEDLGDIFNTTLYGEIAESMDILSEGAEAYQSAIDKLHNADAQLELSNYLKTNDINSQEAFDRYIDGIENSKEYSESYKQVLLEVVNDAFPQFSAAAKDASDSASNFANKIDVSSILSGVQSLSDGLDQLDKIYADVKDGEYFDFSSILNNKEFTEAFGDLGESYENFIETITNSPSDIKACQSAFNDLATAYINNSSALENVTEETKNSTIAMLKQMGVANAEEIVINQLKAKTLAQSDVFKDLTSATLENTDELYNNVQQLIAEADASGITISAMADLVAQQQIFNNQDLDVNSKIQSLAKLASAFGAVADAANISAHQQYMATEISMAYRNGASASDIESIKNGYLKSASSTFQNAISAKFGSLSSKINYTGGSKTNGGSSKSQSEKEFNWIETLLSRIQNKISDLGKTASATWKSWTERNSALKNQMSAVSQEISLQQQAISKYESLAGSLGLSSYYQNLVKNGALDISTITDDNLADKISKYQEYWEKIVSAEDAIQDLEDELRNLARTEFDNVAKQFDSEISLVEANISTLEAYIDQTEMKGNLVSKNYYSAMYAEEQKNLAYLQQKYDQLSNKLNNGTIVQGSEEFNEMATEIKEVSKAIIESNTALEEYQKTMRELDWEVFDLIEEKIGNVTEESEFLIDLLSNSKLFNDNGSITSQGQATLGLHVANMKVYESQVSDYAQAIADLDKEFANDSLDQNYLDRREELVSLQRDMILQVQEERNSIKDLMSQGYDNLLSYMDELIAKRKSLLSQASDARSFQKTVQEQTDEIARLQNIINSYGGSLSEEDRAIVQKHQVSLEKAESDLEDTLYDKYVDEQQKMLDALTDDTEQFISERLENTDKLISDVVEATDANTETIKTTLETEVRSVGGTLTTEMQSLWSGSDGIKGVVGGVNDTLLDIKALVQSMVKGSDTEASKNASDATTSVTPTTTPVTTPSTSNSSNNSSTSAKAITVGGMIDASGALIYDYAGDTSGERQYYRNSPYYRVLGEKNGYLKVRHQSLSSGTTGWFKKSDVKAYKTGGLVDETGLAWLDGTKSKPELVLNSEQTENHLKLTKALETVAKTNMFDAIQSYAKLPQFTTNSSGNKSVEIHFENMTFPYVKNADDFITDLQHSKRFENVVLAITDGKGNLDKYKY